MRTPYSDISRMTHTNGVSSAEVAGWSMQKRLSVAANDYSDPETLLRLTEWVLEDLDRSLEGFDTFAAWRPNPPEERDVDILSALSKNPSLPDGAVDLIVISGWWRLKPRILFHPSLTLPLLNHALAHLVATESSAIWKGASFSSAAETWYYALSENSGYTPETWSRVAREAWGVPRLLALVASRNDLDEETYVRLAFHPNLVVRQNIARNEEAPAHARVSAALGV